MSMEGTGTIGSKWLTLSIALALVACGASTGQHGGAKGNIPVVIEASTVTSPEVAATLAKTRDTAAMNVASDAQMNLLVTLYLDDGNLVRFYEPAPGHIFYTLVTVGGKPLDARVPGYQKLSAVELFRALATISPVPEILSEAQSRADAFRPVTGKAKKPAGPPVSTPSSSVPAVTVKTAPTVRPLDCGGCANWCDYSCWSCRHTGFGGGYCGGGNNWYQWCYGDAFNGASADNGGGSDGGTMNVCSVTGSPTLTISSDVWSGNTTIGPQQEIDGGTQQTSYCFAADDGQKCDENIHFSVTGSNIHVRFAGAFLD
jgi:hypothetical protein